MTPANPEPPKRKRRWYQFSLRSLLIFTMICAVACGLLGKRMEQKRKEREGDRGYRQVEPFEFGETIAGLIHLQGLNRLQRISLWKTKVTDAGLEQVQELTNLRELYLHSTNSPGPGARRLRFT